MGESQPLVKREAGLVCRINPSDENMVILRSSSLDNLLQQTSPDALTAKARVNVNRVLDRIFVGRPCPEGAETGKSHQRTALSLRANHGIVPLRFRFEP